jgi:hypothetical protein
LNDIVADEYVIPHRAPQTPLTQFPLFSLLLSEDLLAFLQCSGARAELKEDISKAKSLLRREAPRRPQGPQRCLHARRRL